MSINKGKLLNLTYSYSLTRGVYIYYSLNDSLVDFTSMALIGRGFDSFEARAGSQLYSLYDN